MFHPAPARLQGMVWILIVALVVAVAALLLLTGDVHAFFAAVAI